MILGNFLTASICSSSISCWRGSQRCWRGQTFLEVTPSPTAIRDSSLLLYTWHYSDPQRVQRSASLCPGLAQGTESWKGQDAFCRTPRKYLCPILLHELIHTVIIHTTQSLRTRRAMSVLGHDSHRARSVVGKGLSGQLYLKRVRLKSHAP